MSDERISKIMFGTDPEYFMRETDTGKLVSAVPHIKGGKHNPIAMKKSGGTLQHDNVAVEFSTQPANSPKAFAGVLRATLKETISMLPAGHELVADPSAVFEDDELQTPEAQQFGCTPDFDAWQMCENSPPAHNDPRFRSCGGHIHVGALDANGNLTHEDAKFLLDFDGMISMVKGMDVFLGIISTILDSSPEAIERRKLYGKAGCHRETPYGVEYRTLSNYWTKSPTLSVLMASLTEDVVEVIISGKLDALIEEIGEQDIQRIINTGAVEDAQATLERILMPYLSGESRDLLEMALELVEKPINEAWEIQA